MVRTLPTLTLLALVACVCLPGCGAGAGLGGEEGTAPTITAASASAGFTPGGARVTVTGSGFTDPIGVTFTGASASNVTILDDTTFTCTVPPGLAGPSDIEVAVAGGVGSASVFTYVAYPPSAGLDIQINGEGTPTEEERTPASAPTICCSGENVYVVWSDHTGGGSDVYFQRSSDRGVTWLPEDIRLNTNDVGGSGSYTPQLCCSDRLVYVAWYDSRNTGGSVLARSVYVNRSTDGGTTWLASDVEVSPGQAIVAGFLKMCCDGEDVHLTWADQRNLAQGAIFVNSSTDAGATWHAQDIQVSTAGPSPANVAFIWGQPQICCSGPNVYVSWPDTRNGPDADLWCVRSTDRGTTWTGEVRIDRDTTGGSAAIASPGNISHAMCCNGSLVYVAWIDNRDVVGFTAGWDVYANASEDGGLTFRPTDVRVNTPDLAAQGLRARNVRLCCEGSTLHVVWSDDRSTDDHVFYNRSLDAGLTFELLDERLDPGGTGVRTGPYIACCGGPVHVTWTDGRDVEEAGVFVNSSPDDGVTWLASEIRLDRDVPGEAELPRNLANNSGEQPICCDGAYPFVVWWDDRNQPGTMSSVRDIFFGTYE